MITTEARTIQDQYYSWLRDWVETTGKRNKYNILLKSLHDKKFKWFVPNDDNRAFEGINLRQQFCEEELNLCFSDLYDSNVIIGDNEATMLEVILALAFRCDSIMADNADNVSINDWFWRLLNNAELDIYDDEYCGYSCDSRYEIDKILEKIINRTYKRNGEGALFPLKKSKKDQRKIELWYQMCQFLVENFYCEGLIL
jgi:hypothetical protein